MIYKVETTFKLSSVCKEANELEDGVNETLSGAGFDEKIQVMSSLHVGNLSVSRKLKQGEEKKMVKLFEENLSKILPGCKVKLICSQSSGNSKQ